MKCLRFLSFGLLCVALGAGCQPSSPMPSVSSSATSAVVATDTVAVVSSSTAVVVPVSTSTSSTVNAASSTPPTSHPSPARPVARPKPTPDPVKQKPSTWYVNIMEDAFSPKVLVVRAGDSVVWVNRSHRNHTVVASEAALLWDSGNLAPGKSFTHLFPYPGTYNYLCGIHATMKATIVVR